MAGETNGKSAGGKYHPLERRILEAHLQQPYKYRRPFDQSALVSLAAAAGFVATYFTWAVVEGIAITFAAKANFGVDIERLSDLRMWLYSLARIRSPSLCT